VAVAAAALCLTLAVTTPSLADNPYGPGYKSCGSFRASDYRIRVYAKDMTCRRAVRIQKEYWLGKRKDKRIVNGGTGASGYVLLDKYPGWKCTSGSGGGGCRKDMHVAAYQN
jgi:hypothetical protein